MSQNCSQCQRDVFDEAVCPHCLAPIVVTPARYTQQLPEGYRPKIGADRPRLDGLPDLREAVFYPSSPVYRVFLQAKGGLASALIACLLVAGGGFWYVQAKTERADAIARQAQGAFDARRYETAIELWSQARAQRVFLFDKEGQREDLVNLSRCYVQTGQLDLALTTLASADKLPGEPELKSSIAKVHRLAGVRHLREAETLFQPDLYGKAYLEAQSALREFTAGEGSGKQLADAHRMAARCSIKLRDFEGSESHLAEAIELEGDSRANLALRSELKTALVRERKQRLADSSQHRYIPSGKIDPIPVAAPPPPRHTARRSTSRPEAISGGTTSPRPAVASYPTHQTRRRPYPTSYPAPHIPDNLPPQARASLERAYSPPGSPSIPSRRTGPNYPVQQRYPARPTQVYSKAPAFPGGGPKVPAGPSYPTGFRN